MYKPTQRVLKSQDVNITAASVASTALGSVTTVVRLVASVACYVAFGSAPTAAAGGVRLAPNFPEYFLVVPGTKVATIEVPSGTTGTLNIVEMG